MPASIPKVRYIRFKESHFELKIKPDADIMPPSTVIDRHPNLSTKELIIGPDKSGTAMKRLPIHEVALFEASNSLRNSTYKRPKENVTPLAIIHRSKVENTTTQPHPPSGIFESGLFSSVLSSGVACNLLCDCKLLKWFLSDFCADASVDGATIDKWTKEASALRRFVLFAVVIIADFRFFVCWSFSSTFSGKRWNWKCASNVLTSPVSLTWDFY